MKQFNTIAIKLIMFIIFIAGIVSACSMNCDCCDSEKTQTAKTDACCTEQISTSSLITRESAIQDESERDYLVTCTTCNCNALPQHQANTVSSNNRSLHLYAMPVYLLNHSTFFQDLNVCKTVILSLSVRSASLTPLRI